MPIASARDTEVTPVTPDVSNPEFPAEAALQNTPPGLRLREHLHAARRQGAAILRGTPRALWARKWLRFAGPPVVLLLLAGGMLVHHLYWDRDDLPALEPFVRFEPPTTGQVRDAEGRLLIEVAREYRSIVRYDEIPSVVRHAILAAEDKSFFEHQGIDYGRSE